MDTSIKIALVHDWLTALRGGERVLEVLCELFPTATLFTLLHNEGSVSPPIERMEIRTSFVQHLPFKHTRYRHYLPLFPRAIEALRLSEYDLVLSSSHCVAKGVRPRPDALHICYCHTPMRYVWDMYDEYFGKGRASWPVRAAMTVVAPRLRAWDVRTSGRVHHFIANSRNVAQRIRRIYNRDAEVIYPPVDTSRFRVSEKDERYFLIVSALVPYKRVELAVQAFTRLGEKLLIVGSGPEEARLKAIAPKNVEFLGWQSDEEVAKLYAGCRALIFPGVEDFGIVPLEAMASGKPVVAFAQGGALETVVEGGEQATGVFFYEQTPDALLTALSRLPNTKFDPTKIRQHAERFDRTTFQRRLREYIEARLSEARSNRPTAPV